VPVGSVAAGVGIVGPVDNVVLLPALESRPGMVVVFVGAPDPVAPGEVVIGELPEPCEDVLLLDVEELELIDESDDEGGVACVNSREIPLMPSTEPVWTLDIGLHGVDFVVFVAGGPGVWLGGGSEVGFGWACASALDAHAMLMQMNKGSFMSNLRYCPAVRITGDSVQAGGHVRLLEA
jgi:hypothetical protein